MTQLDACANAQLFGTTNAPIQSLYDGVNLIAEYDAANILQRRFVHGPGVDEPLVQYEGVTTTNKSWFYADHQGSVVATADSAGVSTGIYSYGPYGEPSIGGPARFRYTGQQYFDNPGLYYYKARFYSPTLGKFMQTDPIGYEAKMKSNLITTGGMKLERLVERSRYRGETSLSKLIE